MHPERRPRCSDGSGSSARNGRRPRRNTGLLENACPRPIVFRFVDGARFLRLLEIDQLLTDGGTLEFGIVSDDASAESGENDGGGGECEATRVVSIHRWVPQFPESRSVSRRE